MKIPIIKDVRTFLTIASINGYIMKGGYCYKNIIYSKDCGIEIKINLNNGYINCKMYWDNIFYEMDDLDKSYHLRDIDYLIKWINIEGIDIKQ